MKSYKKMLKNTLYATVIASTLNSYGQKLADKPMYQLPMEQDSGIILVSGNFRNSEKEIIVGAKPTNVQELYLYYEGESKPFIRIPMEQDSSPDIISMDRNKDGYSDLTIALKMGFGKTGSIVYLENDGKGNFINKTKIEKQQ